MQKSFMKLPKTESFTLNGARGFSRFRVMQLAPEKQTGEDGLPVPPYTIYNIGNNSPEKLLDFVTILQEEFIAAGVLPTDYDFAQWYAGYYGKK